MSNAFFGSGGEIVNTQPLPLFDVEGDQPEEGK